MQTVYVSTSGAYSDYHVVGIYRNEEDAKNCPFGDDYEEFTLQDGPMDVRYHYTAQFQGGFGPAKSIEIWDEKREYDGNDKVGLTKFRNMYGPVFTATGWDKEKVVKVVSDARAAFVAALEEIA